MNYLKHVPKNIKLAVIVSHLLVSPSRNTEHLAQKYQLQTQRNLLLLWATSYIPNKVITPHFTLSTSVPPTFPNLVTLATTLWSVNLTRFYVARCSYAAQQEECLQIMRVDVDAGSSERFQ